MQRLWVCCNPSGPPSWTLLSSKLWSATRSAWPRSWVSTRRMPLVLFGGRSSRRRPRGTRCMLQPRWRTRVRTASTPPSFIARGSSQSCSRSCSATTPRRRAARQSNGSSARCLQRRTRTSHRASSKSTRRTARARPTRARRCLRRRLAAVLFDTRVHVAARSLTSSASNVRLWSSVTRADPRTTSTSSAGSRTASRRTTSASHRPWRSSMSCGTSST